MTRHKIRRTYEDGASVADIAAMLGVSAYTARQLITEAGATIRPRGRPVGSEIAPHIIAAMAKAYRGGETMQAIAKRRGVTKQAVSQLLAHYGFKARDERRSRAAERAPSPPSK